MRGRPGGISSCSHRIRPLQTYFGVPLFKPARTGLVLTPERRRLAEVSKGAFASLGQVGSRLSDFSVSGTISLAAPPLFAAGWLMPRIADFNRDHPDISFRFLNLMDNRPELIREADVIILWVKYLPGGVEGQRLFSISLSLAASPALMIEAAANGYGIALGSFPLNRDLVEAGRLIKPFDLDLDMMTRNLFLIPLGVQFTHPRAPGQSIEAVAF